MCNPLVSVITPCYNGEAYLDRYFNSILNQTYRPLELIFVNDGSTDRTAEIAERYAPVLKESDISFIYLHQENAGQAAAQKQRRQQDDGHDDDYGDHLGNFSLHIELDGISAQSPAVLADSRRAGDEKETGPEGSISEVESIKAVAARVAPF